CSSEARPSAAFDQLNSVPVRVPHETQTRATLTDRVGRLLRLDPLLLELGQGLVEVRRGDRDVPVAGADLVRLGASDVASQLKPRLRAVVRKTHEDVDRLVADRDAADLIEAERVVERD